MLLLPWSVIKAQVAVASNVGTTGLTVTQRAHPAYLSIYMHVTRYECCFILSVSGVNVNIFYLFDREIR